MAKQINADALETAQDMLRIIVGKGCEKSRAGNCAASGRVLGAYYSAEAWCASCVAAAALEALKRL